MKISKIAAIAAVAVVCAALFTACGKGNADEKTTSAETSGTTAAEDTSANTESSIGSETGADTEAEQENNDAEDNGNEEAISNNTLMPIAEAALAVGEWPMLWEVSDSDILKDFFLLEDMNSNYKNLLVLQCPMSSNMTEIIIIEADDVSDAKSDLEARQKKAQDQDAFYPADVERAGASVVGSEGSYAYFLMGDNTPDAEKAITDYIKAM